MPSVATVLKPVKSPVTVTTTEKSDPKAYFTTREGLYVWENFKDRIVAKAKPVKKDTEYAVQAYDLKESATDAVIENNLPTNRLFTPSELCALIPVLIAQQAKGQKGALVNTGYANLFYTKDFVVLVVWNDSAWHVGAWRRDDSRWHAGDRVFSPATDQ